MQTVDLTGYNNCTFILTFDMTQWLAAYSNLATGVFRAAAVETSLLTGPASARSVAMAWSSNPADAAAGTLVLDPNAKTLSWLAPVTAMARLAGTYAYGLHVLLSGQVIGICTGTLTVSSNPTSIPADPGVSDTIVASAPLTGPAATPAVLTEPGNTVFATILALTLTIAAPFAATDTVLVSGSAGSAPTIAVIVASTDTVVVADDVAPTVVSGAVAQRINAVSSTFDADVANLEALLASNNAALQLAIGEVESTVSANADAAAAASAELQTAIGEVTDTVSANADAAAVVTASLQSAIADANSAISDAQTAAGSALSELQADATVISVIQQTVSGNTASITQEVADRASADEAIAGTITTIDANVGAVQASITAESVARADADSATAATLVTVEASTAANAASITAETVARTTADSATAATIVTVQASTAANTAAVTAETVARTTAESSLSAQITTVSAQTNTNTASITTETVARTTADTSLAGSITTTNANVGAVQASVTSETAARVSDEASIAVQLNTLTASTTANQAAISTEAVTRANADSAAASTLSTVSASANRQRVFIQPTAPPGNVDAYWVDTSNGNLPKAWTAAGGWQAIQDSALLGNIAAVTTETAARIDADSSLAGQITSVLAITNGNTAAITTETVARTTGDTSLAGSISTTNASVGANASAISTEAVTRAAADGSLSAQIATLTSASNANQAAIATEAVTRANADSAAASTLSTVSASANRQRVFIQPTAPPGNVDAYWVDTSNGNLPKAWTSAGGWQAIQDSALLGNIAAVTTETAARVSGDTSLAGQITSLLTTTNGNTAAISTETAARTTGDSALAGSIATTNANVGANASAITAEGVARASGDSALTTTLNAVSTTVAGHTASLSTIQTSLNGVLVQYGLLGTINHTTGGFVLTGVALPNGGATFTMEIDANVTIKGDLITSGNIQGGLLTGGSVSPAALASATLWLSNASDTVPAQSAYTPVTYGSVTNTLSNSTFSGGVLTIGSNDAGFYLMTAVIIMNTKCQDLVCAININGVNYSYGESFTPNAADAVSVGSTTFHRLHAGDRVSLYIYQSTYPTVTTNTFSFLDAQFVKLSA